MHQFLGCLVGVPDQSKSQIAQPEVALAMLGLVRTDVGPAELRLAVYRSGGSPCAVPLRPNPGSGVAFVSLHCTLSSTAHLAIRILLRVLSPPHHSALKQLKEFRHQIADPLRTKLTPHHVTGMWRCFRGGTVTA